MTFILLLDGCPDMNPTQTLGSPRLKAIMLAVLVGVLVRIGILAHNTYYQNIGMPYILVIPSAAVVGVGFLYYLLARQ